MVANERRQFERVEVKLPTKIGGAPNELAEARLEDISIGGVRAFIPGASLAVGQRHHIHVMLPELGGALEVEAEVRWVDRADSQRAGFRFARGLRARETYAIEQLLKRQRAV